MYCGKRTSRQNSGRSLLRRSSQLVMGNGEPEQAWITVQVHMNVIAVAVLREFSCIVIADNASVPEEVLARAEEEGIPLLESGIPVFETAKKLVELGI